MRRYRLVFVTMCGVFVAGCVAKPVDISGVSTVADLDKYVGREISFTGRYQPAKQLAISNGKVSIDVYACGAFNTEETVSVKGVLQRAEYPVRTLADERDPMKDRPAAGVHYYLTPATPADAGMTEWKSHSPPHDGSEADDESDSIGMLQSPGDAADRTGFL